MEICGQVSHEEYDQLMIPKRDKTQNIENQTLTEPTITKIILTPNERNNSEFKESRPKKGSLPSPSNHNQKKSSSSSLRNQNRKNGSLPSLSNHDRKKGLLPSLSNYDRKRQATSVLGRHQTVCKKWKRIRDSYISKKYTQSDYWNGIGHIKIHHANNNEKRKNKNNGRNRTAKSGKNQNAGRKETYKYLGI